jgi:hypothetical protein
MLKKTGIYIFTLFVLFSCNKKRVDLHSFIGENIHSNEVKTFTNDLEGTTEVRIFDERNFYINYESGIDFSVNNDGVIDAIFLFNKDRDGHQGFTNDLPYGLSFSMQREETEKLLGPPDSKEEDWAIWDKKGIMIHYENDDPFDMKTGIHHITVYEASEHSEEPN